jgi:hypothetical protein
MIPNTPQYRSFVDPAFCLELFKHGLRIETTFLWVYNDPTSVQLFCKLLDPDGYYCQAYSNIAFVQDAQLNPYPAFQVGDLEILLGNFTVDKLLDKYHVMVEQIWSTQVQTHERMPDAIAMMILELLKAKKINLKKAAELISK